MDRLNKEKISQHIAPHHLSMLGGILLFDSLPSTNDYLLSQAREYPDTQLICLAEQQTAGKGRLGRRWVSPFAENIYLSILWHFPFARTELPPLNIVMGIAVVEAIQRTATIQELQLKWPNDIYWHARKLGGILIEISPAIHDHTAVVIGIGLNVAMQPDTQEPIEKPWDNLNTAAGMQLSRNQLVGSLIDVIVMNLIHLQKQGASSFIKKWNELDYLMGKQISVQSGNKILQGKAAGINLQGQLILNTEHGLQYVGAGEASIR